MRGCGAAAALPPGAAPRSPCAARPRCSRTGITPPAAGHRGPGIRRPGPGCGWRSRRGAVDRESERASKRARSASLREFFFRGGEGDARHRERSGVVSAPPARGPPRQWSVRAGGRLRSSGCSRRRPPPAPRRGRGGALAAAAPGRGRGAGWASRARPPARPPSGSRAGGSLETCRASPAICGPHLPAAGAVRRSAPKAAASPKCSWIPVSSGRNGIFRWLKRARLGNSPTFGSSYNV